MLTAVDVGTNPALRSLTFRSFRLRDEYGFLKFSAGGSSWLSSDDEILDD